MPKLRETRVSRQMGTNRQVGGDTLGSSASTSERVGGGGRIFQLKPRFAHKTVQIDAVFNDKTILRSIT